MFLCISMSIVVGDITLAEGSGLLQQYVARCNCHCFGGSHSSLQFQFLCFAFKSPIIIVLRRAGISVVIA